MNDDEFKYAKLEDSFVWHRHEETDEVFSVVDGEMSIAFCDGQVRSEERRAVRRT